VLYSKIQGLDGLEKIKYGLLYLPFVYTPQIVEGEYPHAKDSQLLMTRSHSGL
jgi:hypothetical protein